MHLTDCLECMGGCGVSYATPDGPEWLPCEACSGRGWVYEEDPSSEVEPIERYYASRKRLGVEIHKDMPGPLVFYHQYENGGAYFVRQSTFKMQIEVPVSKITGEVVDEDPG